MEFYVYILASDRNGTLYIGSTNDLARRTSEHQQKVFPGFTSRYGVARLVYYEVYPDLDAALFRERRMKKWNRSWKIGLIERRNPGWRDLYEDLF